MEQEILGTVNKISLVDKLLAKTVLILIPKNVRPNHLTGVRFLLIPLVIYFIFVEDYKSAFATFLVAAFTDALDGAMARTRRQITEWGKMYDPLADKFLVGSVAVLLLVKFISVYVVSAIILIELLLIANAVYEMEKKKHTIQAAFSGKVKMILQCAGVILVFLFAITKSAPFLLAANIALYFAIVFGAISLFVYRSI